MPDLGRSLFVVLLSLVTAACQTKDLPPQPAFVSYTATKGSAAVPLPKTAARSGVSDARLSQATDKQYFVEFRSRYALSYGHTYVVFGRVNKGGAVISQEVAGLHPASNSPVPYVLGHFVPVPAETGWSDGDLEEEYRSASWRVMLNKPEYDKVVAYIRKLQARSFLWDASLYNCNAFTGDIAHSMGYKIPSKYLRPQEFVTTLRRMNTASTSGSNG